MHVRVINFSSSSMSPIKTLLTKHNRYQLLDSKFHAHTLFAFNPYNHSLSNKKLYKV